MLLKMREMFDASFILVDINEFFNRLKSIEKTINIPAPDEIDIRASENVVFFEWYKTTEPSFIDILKLEFNGTNKIRLVASYETLGIDINQNLPLDEDFPELILTHLKQFKKSTKKKRYK